jgi:hypothetical protein
MGPYISKQVKMYAYHLWDIEQWVLQISLQKIPMESIKWKVNLKWPKIEIVFENFSFLRIFQPGQAVHEN